MLNEREKKSSNAYQQIKRHNTSAIKCVFVEASLSTRVEMVAWHDGQSNLVLSGPTFTPVSKIN